MLLQRSILTKVCLLLAICLVKAQYDYGNEEKKQANKEEEEERDYEKIFAEETAAALTAATEEKPDKAERSDYVVPVEFENYFTPAHIFGESNKQPVKANPDQKKKEPLQTFESKNDDFFSSYFKDSPLKHLFEEPEKKDADQKLDKEQSSKDEEVVPPGPSYISHKVPAEYGFDDEEDKSASASEDVERVPKDNEKGSISDGEEGVVSREDEDYKLPLPFTFEPFKNDKQKVDYNTGKSSSTVSQYNTPAASANFEEYNFKPAEEFEEKKPKAEEESEESAPYEEYNYKPAVEFEPKKTKSAKSGYDKPEASAPYEEYNYKPAEEYEQKKSKSAKSGYNKPAASAPYEEYNYKPAEDYEPKKSKSGKSGYNKPAASTPYEKFSFKPVENYEDKKPTPKYRDIDDYAAQNSKFFDSILSTAAPFNPTYKKVTEPRYETQSSENSPSQLQAKGCKKVSSSSDSDDMSCFVCENPKTNAKYTQCSYTSQQKPVDFYEGNSAKYSNTQKEEPSTYRYKRYADNDENDPYTYIRNRARKASNEGIPSDYSSGFQYEGEHYDESKPELTFSEQHSEEIKKNPANCKKVDRQGMTCTVCQDPKTGGNFEQCSYTSKPKEKKYAYVTEKKFDNDEPSETQVVSQSKEAETNEKQKSDQASKQNAEFIEEYKDRQNQEKNPKKRDEESRSSYEGKPSEKKPADDDNYEFYFSSPTFTESIYKGASSDRAEHVDGKKKDADDFSDFDEYHFKYFPEFAKQESRQEPVQESYEVPVPEATKQNVETVLAEFTKKDRSNCKKAEKKGMTCFLCVDKNNIQNEECMYVQESKPESKHVAYHEVKATENAKSPEAEKITADQSNQESKKESKQETKQEPVAAASDQFVARVPAPAALQGLKPAASEELSDFVKYNPEREASVESETKKDLKKKKRSHKKKEELKSDESAYDSERLDDKAEPTIKTPSEFNVAPGEGAFSDETKAVYSKELGIQLPKYMLEKSEFEKEFDAFSGSF